MRVSCVKRAVKVLVSDGRQFVGTTPTSPFAQLGLAQRTVDVLNGMQVSSTPLLQNPSRLLLARKHRSSHPLLHAKLARDELLAKA